VVFAAVALMLVISATVASAFPGIRAAQVDPNIALRLE
jgi:ABC-type lipoprotein release transport system permease subunit